MNLAEKLDQLGVDKDVQTQLKELASACKEKLGLDEKVILADFDKALEQTKKLPDLSEEERIERAITKVRGEYKQQLRSPAQFYEGVVLAVAEPFDMVGYQRRQAMAAWKEDKEKAIADGICDAEGRPLDTKEMFGSRPNRNFGQPLPEHRYLTNLFGVCRKQGKEDWKRFSMTLGENLALMEVPQNVPVTFRANEPDSQPDDGSLKLNPYAGLEFKKLDAEGMDLKGLFAGDLLKSYRVDLNDLQSAHARLQGDPNNRNRMVLVEGDVQYINIGGERNGMLVLEDSSLSLDDDGITVWVPNHLEKMMNFGAGSRVFLLGSTLEMQRDDGVRYALNGMGVYADPKYRMPADENPRSAVTRKDVQQVS